MYFYVHFLRSGDAPDSNRNVAFARNDFEMDSTHELKLEASWKTRVGDYFDRPDMHALLPLIGESEARARLQAAAR